jgi:hypothetical protein
MIDEQFYPGKYRRQYRPGKIFPADTIVRGGAVDAAPAGAPRAEIDR